MDETVADALLDRRSQRVQARPQGTLETQGEGREVQVTQTLRRFAPITMADLGDSQTSDPGDHIGRYAHSGR